MDVYRDLTFIEEEATFIDDEFINFEKLALISQIFERLQDFRLQLYDIEVSSLLSPCHCSSSERPCRRRILQSRCSCTTRWSSLKRNLRPWRRNSVRMTVTPQLIPRLR